MSTLPPEFFDLPAWSLPAGAILDFLLGDPRGWPHPVRAIGALISWTEQIIRAVLKRVPFGSRWERMAGVILTFTVVGITTLVAWGLVAACDALGSWASFLGRTVIIYWGLAARSLGFESLRVAREKDLSVARQALSEIVGRDTHELDSPEICRACVETVAENTNDAVIAPLFWFAMGGPVALWAFKAVSTLDSMVGYRNERYRHLGWCSARLDDLANLVPARLTWLLITFAAFLTRENARLALVIGWRDGRQHPSPNAAWGEAAMAGALGIQLGGVSTYGGVASTKPYLGDPGDVIEPRTVLRAVRLMHVAAITGVLLAWGLRWWIFRSP